MPTIGWIFLLAALALIVGNLLLLRDSANFTRLSEEKMEKIRKRQKELEEQEKDDDGK